MRQIECESTVTKSGFKVRRETSFLTEVGLPHGEYVPDRASWCVDNHRQPPGQQTLADDQTLSAIPARVLEFHRDTVEDDLSIIEVPAALPKGVGTPCRIASDGQWLLSLR